MEIRAVICKTENPKCGRNINISSPPLECIDENNKFEYSWSYLGVVLNSGQFPTAGKERDSMLGTGPMCRFAIDLEPMLRIMAGNYGLSKLKLDNPVDLRNLRYFSIGDDVRLNLVSALDPELKKAQEQVIFVYYCLINLYSSGFFFIDLSHPW